MDRRPGCAVWSGAGAGRQDEPPCRPPARRLHLAWQEHHCVLSPDDVDSIKCDLVTGAIFCESHGTIVTVPCAGSSRMGIAMLKRRLIPTVLLAMLTLTASAPLYAHAHKASHSQGQNQKSAQKYARKQEKAQKKQMKQQNRAAKKWNKNHPHVTTT